MAYTVSRFNFIKHENKELLGSRKIYNFEQLSDLLNEIEESSRSSPYPSLRVALQKFTEFMNTQVESWSFYTDLFPYLVSWATENISRNSGEFLLMEAKKEVKNIISPSEARYVLANSFFLNLHNLRMTFQMQKRTIGALDFSLLYKEKKNVDVAAERILFLLSYFVQSMQVQDRPIEFERFTIQKPPNWKEDQTPINVSLISIYQRQMEASPSSVVVDFSNKDIHKGEISTNLTQEEILFSACPEALVSLLFTEQFLNDEVMHLRGLKKFSDYTYSEKELKFKGFYEGTNNTLDLVVIDANKTEQFSTQIIDRDLNKAWKGFKEVKNSSTISTSYWGHEAQGADKFLKFLQQVCAATLAGKKLEYSTSNEEDTLSFETALLEMGSSQITVAQVYQIMTKYSEAIESNQYGVTSFVEFGMKGLKMKEGDWTYNHLIVGGSVVLAAGFVWRLVNMTRWATRS